MADEKTTPLDKDKVEDKETPSDGGAEDKEKESQAHLKDIPEKFKDKSSTDIIKMYGELERKLGEQSTSIKEAKELKANQEVLAKVILSDPKLAKAVEDRVQEYDRGELGKSLDKNVDEEADKDSVTSDLRRSAENRAISEFSSSFGLDQLPKDDKNKVLKKVGQELADMIDPTGKKNMAQVLSSVSLERLPKLLEKSYYLSHMDQVMSGKTDDFEKGMASIGRFSSSSAKSDGDETTLTEHEKEAANKLGVSEEKYLKRKKEIKSK